jgi:hypothetical protein
MFAQVKGVFRTTGVGDCAVPGVAFRADEPWQGHAGRACRVDRSTLAAAPVGGRVRHSARRLSVLSALLLYVRHMEQGVPPMISVQTLRFELAGRVADLWLGTKNHISVRWEPAPAIVRVGLMIDDYTWDNRMRVLQMLLAFERDHADEFALEFDIVPLAPVQSDDFAEA